jgi:Lar family restriction alleviation protein
MPENEMKPCPFCGGEPNRCDIEAREDVDNAGASYIECTKCGACTQLHFDRKENLLDSWNARVPAQSAGGGEPKFDPRGTPLDHALATIKQTLECDHSEEVLVRRHTLERLCEPRAVLTDTAREGEYERGWKAALDAAAKLFERWSDYTVAADTAVKAIRALPAAPSNVGTGEGHSASPTNGKDGKP